MAALVLVLSLAWSGLGLAQGAPRIDPREGSVLAPNVFDIAYSSASDKQHNILSNNRYKTSDFPLVFKALELKPGDSVLDVGAGVGFFAFPLAKAMNNQGVVYATEVDGNMLSILDATAAKNGISIIKTVKVSPRGLDSAYKKHRYNKCLVAGVFQDMEDPVGFMRQLLPQFEKNSPVVVVHSEAFVVHPVLEGQVPIHSILRVIEESGSEHPLTLRMPVQLKARLASSARGPRDEELERELAVWLQSLLVDPLLARDLLRVYSKHFVSWKAHLVEVMDQAKVLTVEWMLLRYQALDLEGPLTEEEQYLIRGLNLTMLEQLLFGGSKNGSGLVQSGAALRLQMEQAGLVFQSQELVNSFFWVLVFRTP
jgi:protein-L-isoaspartate O-methyltransferase